MTTWDGATWASNADRLTTTDALQVQGGCQIFKLGNSNLFFTSVKYNYCPNYQNDLVYCQGSDLLGYVRPLFRSRLCDNIIDCIDYSDENGQIEQCEKSSTESGCC